jgi:hypothetical protein
MAASNKCASSGKKSSKPKGVGLTIAIGVGKAKKIPKSVNNPAKGMKMGKKSPKSSY